MTIGARIGAGFAAGLVIIAAIGGSAYLSTQRLLEANRWVTHTHQVIEGLEHVLSVLETAETDQRGFVVTGEERYLEPFDAAAGQVRRDIDALVELTRDNRAQQVSLQEVRRLADAKLAALRETIQLRRKSSLEPALLVTHIDRGAKIMDELRGVVAEMMNREQQLLKARNDAANASADRTIWTIAVWMPIALLVLAIAAVVLMRSVPFGGPAAPPSDPGKKWRGIAMRYASALVIVAVVAELQRLLVDSIGPLPPFITFYPAILLVASIGGGGPGILATLLSALAADYWFIPPYGSFSVVAPNDALALGIFTGAGFFLSVLAERLRRARWAEAVSATQAQQLEELSRLNEALSQQSEEISQQSEELAQQNEELQTQSEEIQALNMELAHREDLLQKLLDAARLRTAEKTVLHEICATAKEMFGPAASAVVVLEPQGSLLSIRGQAGLGPDAAKVESLPATHCFVELVIAENETACLADAALRPDLTLMHPPGEQPFRAVLAAPMRGEGRPFGAVGIFSCQTQEWTAEQFRLAEWLAAQCTHILETLRLQEQLRRLYEEQQTIFNSVPAMIWYKDTKNNFVRVNRAVALSVGKPLDQIEGKSAYEVFPDEADHYYQDDLEVIHSGQPKLGIVEEMGTADGEKRWVQTDKIPYRGERDEIIGVLALTVDITERKRAERSLARLAAIVESSDNAILSKDLNGIIQTWNAGAERLFSYRAEEVIGQPFTLLVPPDGIQEEEAILQRIRNGQHVEHWETVRVAKDGRRIDVSVTVSPVKGQDGQIIGVSKIVRDISDRKRAEEALRSVAQFPNENPYPVLRIDRAGTVLYANRPSAGLFGPWQCEVGRPASEPLVRLVRETLDNGQAKQIDLESGGQIFSFLFAPIVDSGYVNLYGCDVTDRKRAEDALRRTAEDLARSNKDLEQFAYVASHDLREPLRMVTGFMSLLKDRCLGKLDAKADEYIAFACDGATRMQGLIDDLLAYSRAGRGEMAQRTDVGAVLDRVLTALTVSIQESGAVITHDPLPTITCNPMGLSQVFQNLIGNALTFKGERKPEIHVGVRRQPGGWLFTVRDNGIGIDPQFTDRIFLIFQRLHTREQYPGTGIGLAICKKVVERHGGRIWVESQPGDGSTFCFTIPDQGKEQE